MGKTRFQKAPETDSSHSQVHVCKDLHHFINLTPPAKQFFSPHDIIKTWELKGTHDGALRSLQSAVESCLNVTVRVEKEEEKKLKNVNEETPRSFSSDFMGTMKKSLQKAIGDRWEVDSFLV